MTYQKVLIMSYNREGVLYGREEGSARYDQVVQGGCFSAASCIEAGFYCGSHLPEALTAVAAAP